MVPEEASPVTLQGCRSAALPCQVVNFTFSLSFFFFFSMLDRELFLFLFLFLFPPSTVP